MTGYFVRLKRRSQLPEEKRDTEAIFAAADGTLKHMDPDGNVEDLGGGGNGGSQPGYVGPFTLYALQGQAIDASGEQPDAGTIVVAYGGVDSDPIAFNADGAAVEAALDAIPALTGKVTVDTFGGFQLPNAGICFIALDPSLAPFELLTLSNNAFTASAAPVADPLIYTAGTLQTDLLTPNAGDSIDDFQISVPQGEGCGSGSVVYFAPESGDVDWPNGLNGKDGLLVDTEDGSENWTASQNGDGPEGMHSMALAMAADAALGNGNYPTLPCVCNVPSVIQANLKLAGQGNGGTVLVWVKITPAEAPS